MRIEYGSGASFVFTIALSCAIVVADAGGEELVPLTVELPVPQVSTNSSTATNVIAQQTSLMVPADVQLISRGKPVTASEQYPVIGAAYQVTDGDKRSGGGSYVELGSGRQYAQIDLQAEYEIFGIVLWHYYATPRTYHDVVIQVGSEQSFTNDVTTVFNNDHDNSSALGIGSDEEVAETHEGMLVDAGGAQGRYVRLYSRGNTPDGMNNYVEVEVWGRLAQ